MGATNWFYARESGKSDSQPLALRSIMEREVRSLTPEALVMDAMQLVREHGIRHIPIVAAETGMVAGLVTETDLLRNVLHGKSMTPDEEYHATLDMLLPLKEVMTRNVHTLPADAPVEKAVALFLKQKIRCAPVTDEDGKLAGIVTETDLLKLLEHVVAS